MLKNEEHIAVYSRKSKFTGKGESVENQIELCREYIQNHLGREAEESILVFEDEGFSGGNLNRPGFKQMMQEAEKHKFRAVVVYRLDRISRNISDFSGLIEKLTALNVDFISVREQFDTGTPMGRAMMYIASVFAQLERETIAERIRDNMRELAKTGRWLGGTTPTGYTSLSTENIRDDGRAVKSCRLELIPEEAEKVKRLFEVFNETDSLTGTETSLMQSGIKTKNGGYFTRFSIKAILQNPVYMKADREAYRYFKENKAELFSEKESFDGSRGIMAYNRTAQEKGRTTVYLPVSEWIVAVGAHQGIIPGRQWVGVQDALERNKSKSYRKPRKNNALLTGLIFCGCGGHMYPRLGKNTVQDGSRSFSYVCRMKERSRGELCKSKNIDGYGLDKAVLRQLAKTEDKLYFTGKLSKSREYIEENTAEIKEKVKEYRLMERDTERKIETLIDCMAGSKDNSVRESIAERIARLKKDQQSLKIKIADIKNPDENSLLSSGEFEHISSRLSDFYACTELMTSEQKRSIVRSTVEKLIWDGTDVHLYFLQAALSAEYKSEMS